MGQYSDMRRLVCILIALAFCKAAWSQDMQLLCGNHKLNCEHGGKSHFYDILHCPYTEYSDTHMIPYSVRQINQNYLLNRLGESFINSKVKLRNVLIVDSSHFDEISKTKARVSNSLCDKKIKYAFEYYFAIQDSLYFYFATLYDDKGNLLFEAQIPDIKNNPHFDQYLDACEIRKIALSDRKFKGDIESLKLEFDREKNRFIWLVEKPGRYAGKDKRTHYSRFIIIHAQSGKILAYKTTKSILVCALPDF